MIIAGEKMSNEQRYDFIRKFGVGQDNGLGFPGESDGLLYSSDQWDLRTQNTVLFGQAYTTNALQLTNAVAVIANKGVKKPQRIIKTIRWKRCWNICFAAAARKGWQGCALLRRAMA